MSWARALMAAVLVASSALAQRLPELERAQALVAERQYAPALSAVEAALKKPNLDRDTLLTILELKGLAEVSTGKTAKAEDTFALLLTLDPRRGLKGKYAGKVMEAAAAAEAKVASAGPLELSAQEPTAEGGQLSQVSVRVKDARGLVKLVRFHLRDGSAWRFAEVQVVAGVASTPAKGASAQWWAEALGERSAQLALVGSASKLMNQVAPPKPVEVVASDVPTRAPQLLPAAVVEPAPAAVAPAARTSALRPVGYALLGAGVLAAGVGAGFGVASRSARAGISAELAAGQSSQAELYARDQTAIRNAAVANALFIAGGALGITGAILWFVGRDVQVTPGAGGGVVVSGALP